MASAGHPSEPGVLTLGMLCAARSTKGASMSRAYPRTLQEQILSASADWQGATTTAYPGQQYGRVIRREGATPPGGGGRRKLPSMGSGIDSRISRGWRGSPFIPRGFRLRRCSAAVDSNRSVMADHRTASTWL